MFSISFLMSSHLQALVRGVGLKGLGKRPLATPAHQVLWLTGISAKTCLNLINPVSGSRGVSFGTLSSFEFL